MCGIVGYIGNKNAARILLNGLHRLEYRGYDSAGMALVNFTQHCCRRVDRRPRPRQRGQSRNAQGLQARVRANGL